VAKGTKAQAVGADFALGAGLALQTKLRFNLSPQDLRRRHPDAKPGYIVEQYLPDGSIMLLCVSKTKSTSKIYHDPDKHIKGVVDMVNGLALYCKENQVRKLTLPHLCSGLDGVDHLFVRSLFYDAFKDQRIYILFLTYSKNIKS
jgi:hypothetical protein